MGAMRNTTLSFGLLTVPVALHKVSTREDVKIDRASPNGNKLKRVEIDSVTGETVDSLHVQRGIYDNPRTGEGFREIPDAAIDAIEAETKLDGFQIEGFIPLKDVPFERVQDAYFLGPQKGANAKPLRLLHEALRRTKKAGVLKFVLTKRQYAGVVYALNGGLVLNIVAFASDFRRAAEASDSIAHIDADAKMTALTVELVESMTVERSTLDVMEDDLVPLKQRLVEAALAGKPVKTKSKRKAEVDGGDVIERLQASIDASKKRAKIPA